MGNKKYHIGLYEKAMPSALNWKEKLQCAGTAAMTLWRSASTRPMPAWPGWSGPRGAGQLRETMQKVGVPIRSMCLSGHRKYPFGASDPAVRQRSLEIMEKAIQLADDLGIRVIQLAGYDVYYEEGTEQTRKDFAENLKKAVEMAAVHGVVLGFETMETEFMNTVEKSMQYVKLIDNPYLGVYPDVGNLTNAAKTYGTSVLDDLETGRGHLVAMHLKETGARQVPGDPLPHRPRRLSRRHPQGWQLGVRRFVTEMWDTGKPEWKEDICFAHDKMSEILDTME